MVNVLKYWTKEEFEISSYRWHLKDRINNSYTTSGSDNTGICTYTYNELGFRGESITKDGFKIMSIGCSNTEGVGVQDDCTWPHLFSRLVPNGVNNNMGVGGRSNDFISRCLLTYFDIIKPDLVLIMYTSLHRREVFTDDGGIEPYILTNAWGFMEETNEGRRTQKLKGELHNHNEDLSNWYKNHLLIKYFLDSKKCNWLWNGWMGVPGHITEPNRFDGNYGLPFRDLGVDGKHPGPNHNKEYSENLYKHIFRTYRNYLPLDSKEITHNGII